MRHKGVQILENKLNCCSRTVQKCNFNLIFDGHYFKQVLYHTNIFVLDLVKQSTLTNDTFRSLVDRKCCQLKIIFINKYY